MFIIAWDHCKSSTHNNATNSVHNSTKTWQRRGLVQYFMSIWFYYQVKGQLLCLDSVTRWWKMEYRIPSGNFEVGNTNHCVSIKCFKFISWVNTFLTDTALYYNNIKGAWPDRKKKNIPHFTSWNLRRFDIKNIIFFWLPWWHFSSKYVSFRCYARKSGYWISTKVWLSHPTFT